MPLRSTLIRRPLFLLLFETFSVQGSLISVLSMNLIHIVCFVVNRGGINAMVCENCNVQKSHAKIQFLDHLSVELRENRAFEVNANTAISVSAVV